MTRDEALGRIQTKLGFRSDLVTTIGNALMDQQTEIEKRDALPWWLITDITNLATIIDEEKVAVPSDFLREYEDPDGGDQLWYFNAAAPEDEDKWTVIVKANTETLREAYPGSGPPKLYALTGEDFRIAPTPDAVYTLRMIYYKKDTVLSSNITNGWLTHAPRILIGYAGIEVSEALRDNEARGYFADMAALADDRLDTAIEARAHANYRYIIGGVD